MSGTSVGWGQARRPCPRAAPAGEAAPTPSALMQRRRGRSGARPRPPPPFRPCARSESAIRCQAEACAAASPVPATSAFGPTETQPARGCSRPAARARLGPQQRVVRLDAQRPLKRRRGLPVVPAGGLLWAWATRAAGRSEVELPRRRRAASPGSPALGLPQAAARGTGARLATARRGRRRRW